MKISDLPCFDTIPTKNVYGGSTLLGIEAAALALGEHTYTFTNTSTVLKQVGKFGKVTIGKGDGTAFALGDIQDTHISYFYGGFDRIKVIHKEHDGKHFSFEKLIIRAIDLPNQ